MKDIFIFLVFEGYCLANCEGRKSSDLNLMPMLYHNRSHILNTNLLTQGGIYFNHLIIRTQKGVIRLSWYFVKAVNTHINWNPISINPWLVLKSQGQVQSCIGELGWEKEFKWMSTLGVCFPLIFRFLSSLSFSIFLFILNVHFQSALIHQKPCNFRIFNPKFLVEMT